MPAPESRATASDARSAPPDGALVHVDLDLLDDNPFQPRTTIDEAPLAELAASISQSGLLHSIAVRPAGGGRYQIVAGHRRVAAFKKLKQGATTDEDRRRYRLIPAQVKRGLDDSQMAVGAYVENASRADLTPLEEAIALLKIKDLTGAANAKELASAVGQNEQRVRRLLRLADAPKVVKDAVTTGILVEVERGEPDGSPGRRERRRLDLLAAIEFIRLHEHILDRKPATAEERVGAAIRRALGDAWGLRRIQEHVERAISGRDADERAVQAEPTAPPPIIERSRDRVVVYPARATSASADQLLQAAKVLNDLALEFTAQSADASRGVKGNSGAASGNGATP
jgi:ParB/RepB/Spo0J family partition protein